MFDSLSSRLGGIFDGLMKRGVLREDDVNEALRMVRVALLEADVALPVAKDFVEKVRAEWSIVCSAHNLTKLFQATVAP